jgi:hypothetical protein
MMKLISTTRPSLLFSLLGLVAAANAQAPRITAIWPPGGGRGGGRPITLTGENLKLGSRVLVSGQGVSGKPAAEGDGTSLVVRLDVAADAEPGVRELRILGPNGASNAARLAIGTLREQEETEPNSTLAAAPLLQDLPVTINGRIDPLGDEDLYRFRAAAGETWVFELGSVSFGSTLDGYLTLRDASGQELGRVMKTLNQDPRLIHTFAAAGEYTLDIRDIAYKGAPTSTYRFSIGKLPTVTRVLPLGVSRGQTTTVRLAGVNLGGMQTMDVAVPADFSGDTLTVVPKAPTGDAAPMKLSVSSLPESVEIEPNDDKAHATRLSTLPAAVSGVIQHPGDVDWYAFHAAANQKLTFDLLARRLGTRLDSYLRLMDSAGKELANNDDAVGKDSRLAWSAPSDGDYFIQVSDLAGDGGDTYGYRLEVTDSHDPDFKLTVMPDVINIPRGGTQFLQVRADRLNEFAGEIALRVEGLPAGLTASTGMIRKGEDADQITVTAAPDASVPGFPLRVVGTATITGKPVERVAEPAESDPVNGAESPRPQRPTLFQVAGVGDPPPYTFTVEPQAVSLAPGSSVKLTIKIQRKPGVEAAKGDIGLLAQNLPAGVDQVGPNIPADKNEGTIELKAPEKLDAQKRNLVIRTRIMQRYQYAPAIPLTIVPKPREGVKAEATPKN